MAEQGAWAERGAWRLAVAQVVAGFRWAQPLQAAASQPHRGAAPAMRRPRRQRLQDFLQAVTYAPEGGPRSGKSVVGPPYRCPSQGRWRLASPGEQRLCPP